MNEVPAVWRDLNRQLAPSPPPGARGTVIHQTGEMRLESGRWVPFTAEQSFEAHSCAFRWHARARMAPLVTVVVEDAYESGHGRLEAKLFGALPVATGEPGVDLDRGELLRYLAELAWNPMAIVENSDLRFCSSPEGLPRVWAHDRASAVDYAFDAAGWVQEIHADTRARGKLGVQPWGARFLRYGELSGAHIPIEAEVWWGGPGSREVYWRGQVTSFEWR